MNPKQPDNDSDLVDFYLNPPDRRMISGGHAKARHGGTSSFDAKPQQQTRTPLYWAGGGGQEEGGRHRQPSTSSVGHILRDDVDEDFK